MEKFKINNSYKSPENLDYDIRGFHKKRTIIKGELLVVEYYRNFDGTNYSDLIVKETRTYNRNGIGLVITRSLNIKWYLLDDTIGCEKNTIKYYSSSESIDEGIVRRKNIFADAKTYLLETIGQAYSFDFLLSVKTQMDYYIEGYKQPLIDAVNNSTKTYMTSQIKTDVATILIF